MEVYDGIMLAVLAGTTLLGAWKGLAWQVASLSSLFVSFFVACTFRAPVAAMIDTEPPWNTFVAMLVLYLGCSLAIWILFRFVSQIIDGVKLTDFDRQAGAVAGFARGVFRCSIITLFAVTLLGEAQQQAVVRSHSGYYIARLLNRAHAVMPAELQGVLAPYIHTLDQQIEAGQGQRSTASQDFDRLPAAAAPAGELPPRPIRPYGDGGDVVDRWLERLPQTTSDGR